MDTHGEAGLRYVENFLAQGLTDAVAAEYGALAAQAELDQDYESLMEVLREVRGLTEK